LEIRSRSEVNSTKVGARSAKGISATLAFSGAFSIERVRLSRRVRKSVYARLTLMVPLVSISRTTDRSDSSLLNLLEYTAPSRRRVAYSISVCTIVPLASNRENVARSSRPGSPPPSGVTVWGGSTSCTRTVGPVL
jgi:hypothetical protein